MNLGLLRRILFVLLSVAAIAPNASFAQNEVDAAAALEQKLIDAIARGEKSVVSIARIRIDAERDPVLQVNPFDFADPDQRGANAGNPDAPEFVPNDFGAGVILARRDAPDERYILTNYHVVKGGPIVGRKAAGTSQLYVRTVDGRGFFASIKGADPRSDLAVLEIDYEQLGVNADALQPLAFAQKHEVQKGAIVISLGNPLAIARDGSASAGWGIVSNIARQPAPVPSTTPERNLSSESLHHTGTLIQVDMKLNLGTSGGALLNLRGEFVGLTTSLAALEGYETSAGFAVPADERFQRIFETLARGEEVEYGFLGVAPQNLSPRDVARRGLTLEQASAPVLLQVFQNSPAAKGGLRLRDMVLSIEGRPVLTSLDLMREISLLPPEFPAAITVWRATEQREVTLRVRLGKWPVYDEESLIVTRDKFPQWRGMKVDYPTGRYRFLQQSLSYPNAVVVVDVAEKSAANESKLQSGEYIAAVNGREVTTPAQFHAAVAELSGPVTLRISDGREIILPETVSEPEQP